MSVVRVWTKDPFASQIETVMRAPTEAPLLRNFTDARLSSTAMRNRAATMAGAFPP